MVSPHKLVVSASPTSTSLLHVAPRDRCLSVTNHHIAGLGQLQEITRSSPAHKGKTGPGGYLEERVTTLSQLLRHDGYFTSMSGKWHLGPKPEHHPNERGLNTSLALLPDCAHRYGILPYSHTKPVLIAIIMSLYEPEYDDPRSEPGKVFETASRAIHVQNGKFLLEGEQGPGWNSRRRAPEAFLCITPHISTTLAFPSTPGDMRQVPQLYNFEPEALRQKRLQRLRDLGLIEKSVMPHPLQPCQVNLLNGNCQMKKQKPRVPKPWRGMPVWVDRMDCNIVLVVEYLKDKDGYNNTFILFMGNNGAEVANAEGNIATDAFCTVMDIIPTILDYVGLQHPNSHAGSPVMSLRGKNWMHVLDRLQKISRCDPICNQDYVVDFKTNCSGAIRRGDWKINLVPAPKGPKC
ncbi:hypothetical protein NXS19_011342 [Fusarium pseudograminearum]|nr:hypothetical protein NXS19_011342 [Fusarium pseudograminearum]